MNSKWKFVLDYLKITLGCALGLICMQKTEKI